MIWWLQKTTWVRVGAFVSLMVFFISCAGRQHVIRDVQRDAKSFILRGNDLVRQGKYEEAASFYERARVASERVDDRAGVAEALNNEGQVMTIAGDYVAAGKKFDRAAAINRDIGHRSGIAANLVNRGYLQIEMGDAQGALISFDEALTLSRLEKDRQGEATVLNNMGRAHHLVGNDERARERIEDALLIAKAQKRHRLAAACYHNLGELEEARDKWDRALFNYQRALAEDRLVEYSIGISGDLADIARVMSHLERFAEARDHLDRALRINLDLRNKPLVMKNLESLIALSERVGDTSAVHSYRDISRRLQKEQKAHPPAP